MLITYYETLNLRRYSLRHYIQATSDVNPQMLIPLHVKYIQGRFDIKLF